MSDPAHWHTNPRLYLSVGRNGRGEASVHAPLGAAPSRAHVFIEVGQTDPRLSHGKDGDKFLLPISLHVLPSVEPVLGGAVATAVVWAALHASSSLLLLVGCLLVCVLLHSTR